MPLCAEVINMSLAWVVLILIVLLYAWNYARDEQWITTTPLADPAKAPQASPVPKSTYHNFLPQIFTSYEGDISDMIASGGQCTSSHNAPAPSDAILTTARDLATGIEDPGRLVPADEKYVRQWRGRNDPYRVSDGIANRTRWAKTFMGEGLEEEEHKVWWGNNEY
jgi:hypothetical protein